MRAERPSIRLRARATCAAWGYGVKTLLHKRQHEQLPAQVRRVPQSRAECPMSNAVEIRELEYRAGKSFEIRDLDVNVASGSIHGFLDPNGAGKTTTIRLMQPRASGTDRDRREYRPRDPSGR